MIDSIGQEIKVGDTVLIYHGNFDGLKKGVVLKLTPKMVRVEVYTSMRSRYSDNVAVYPNRVVVISDIIKANPELFI